jgi:acyl-CoA reductase-like NAD-dependent aldehyde dehydrogenase
MSEITRVADVRGVGGQTTVAGASQRGDIVERGLLIDGKSVPASSGQLTDDVSPWDGEIYARVAAVEGPNATLIGPVVLTDVTTDMAIYASEIFGPAVVVHPVDSTDAAIDLANDTEYGLTGGVISRDVNTALDVASRVRSGIIHINDQGIGDEPMAPFGGVKHSGYGKFGGSAGIESFTEQRWVTIQHSGRPTCPF